MSILLDIGLPKLDGYEVARRLRQQPEGRSVRVAAGSGSGKKRIAAGHKEAGFDHHLVKPVDPAALEKLLAEVEDRPA